MRLLLFFCVLFFASCREQNGDVLAVSAPQITSTDFVLLPCVDLPPDRACALLMAGGKRILIGAPDGVSNGLGQKDLQNLDAVLLLSLRGQDIEGLGAIRNATWQAGRVQQLLVAGPLGVQDINDGLNTVYEAADAFAYVEGRTSGGYDVAPLKPVTARGRVFDTGDLKIDAREDSAGYVGYDVNYNGVHVVILPCGHSANSRVDALAGDYILACDAGEAQWPVHVPAFINDAKQGAK